MQHQVDENILSIPPYISTSWENVHSLQILDEATLVIMMKDKSDVKINSLEKALLEKIFASHAKHLSSKKAQPKQINPLSQMNLTDNIMSLGIPMKIGQSLEGFGQALQHNPEQSQSPDLPKEVLEKISQISKIVGQNEMAASGLKPEPHCNCMHCQIARAILEQAPINEEEEEIVSDEELTFKEWDIQSIGENLYSVSNPLNEKEQYNVYLGKPLGCTCGNKNCEHIRAVLNT